MKTRPKKIRRPVAKPAPAPINRDLCVRTVAEEMWLWRHRQPSPGGVSRGRRAGAMSQIEAAVHLGVSKSQYTNLERGEATLIKATELGSMCARGSWGDPPEPTIAELCHLARRRSGLLVTEIVAMTGIRGFVYSRDEEGGADWVRSFWEHEGFQFPPPVRPWLTRPVGLRHAPL